MKEELSSVLNVFFKKIVNGFFPRFIFFRPAATKRKGVHKKIFFVEAFCLLVSFVLLPITVLLMFYKIRFIKLDFDHYGQIIFLDAWAAAFSEEYRGIIIGHRYPNKELLNFYGRHLWIIDNKFFGVLLTPFFFSIIGTVCANPQLSLKTPKIIINNLLNKNSFFLDRFHGPNQVNFMTDVFSKGKKYVIWFDREIGWRHSISKSSRNMPASRSIAIIDSVIRAGFSVLRIGGRNSTKLPIKHDCFLDLSGNDMSPSFLYELSVNGLCVIGSPSGGAVVPSFLGKLPTLYIDLPNAHQPFWQTNGEQLIWGDFFICCSAYFEGKEVRTVDRLSSEINLSGKLRYRRADIADITKAVSLFLNFMDDSRLDFNCFENSMAACNWKTVNSSEDDFWGVYQIDTV